LPPYILYHHTFKHLEQQSEGVLATVYDDSKQQTITVKARFLVGCDGARSRVAMGISKKAGEEKGGIVNTLAQYFNAFALSN